MRNNYHLEKLHSKQGKCCTNPVEGVSWATGSGRALSNVSDSTSCSSGFVGSCIRGGGGELLTTGLALRLGEREALRFLSRFTGDLRRGDGDRVFLLDRQEAEFVITPNDRNTHF